MKLYLPLQKYDKFDKVVINFNQPMSLAMPYSIHKPQASAWYVDQVKFEPVIIDKWEGLVAKGASVNFRNIHFNPHGNGTHTECLGHITETIYDVYSNLKTYHSFAYLISVDLTTLDNGDQIISKGAMQVALKKIENTILPFSKNNPIKALILRTLPNSEEKLGKNYSHSNPPYMSDEAMFFLVRELGIEHFLIDLPSVDKEKDGGKLSAHHIFWQYPESPRYEATITELVYIDNNIRDGLYFLNLQIAPFENDASPSNPCIYELLFE